MSGGAESRGRSSDRGWREACPHADDVVARCLDGSLEAGGPISGDPIGDNPAGGGPAGGGPASDGPAGDGRVVDSSSGASPEPHDEGAWIMRHARSCPACQRALEVSRKLDAVIATASAGTADRPIGERALAAALARVRPLQPITEAAEALDPAEPAPTPRWSRTRLATGALLCSAAGFAIAWLVVRGSLPGRQLPGQQLPGQQLPGQQVRETQSTDPDAQRVATVDGAAESEPASHPIAPEVLATGRPADQGLFAFPIVNSKHLRMRAPTPMLVDWYRGETPTLRTAQDVESTVSLLRSPHLPARLDASYRRVALALGAGMGRALWPPVSARAPDSAELDQMVFDTRLRLAATLAASTRADAHQGWIETLPQLTDPMLRERVLAEGRRSDNLRRSVAGLARQGSLDGLRAAAWLGGSDLDDSLQRWIRRDPDSCTEVVAALALPTWRPARTDLVLDIWRDLVARNSMEASVGQGRELFARLGVDTTRTLVGIARDDRHYERRELALLALAGRRDARAIDELWELVRGEHRGLAHLAALALGHMRPQDLTPLERHARQADAWLLRTALACASSPAAKPWIDAMRLTDEERQFLTAGRYERAQFAVALTLFRDRWAAEY